MLHVIGDFVAKEPSSKEIVLMAVRNGKQVAPSANHLLNKNKEERVTLIDVTLSLFLLQYRTNAIPMIADAVSCSVFNHLFQGLCEFLHEAQG